ncbi:MAG: hypothetical protein IKL07_05290 [Clostridium sp.]|nr:hypothetical protein [Clostridium sp.]
MRHKEEKNYRAPVIIVAMMVLIVLMLLVWGYGIFGRIKDIEEFEREDIVLTDYYWEYQGSGSVLYLIADDGTKYMVVPSKDGEVNQEFFNSNIKRNETLTIYVLWKSCDVYGMQDEEYVYLDVHKAVQEKPSGLTIVFIVLLSGSTVYLLYAFMISRREQG